MKLIYLLISRMLDSLAGMMILERYFYQLHLLA